MGPSLRIARPELSRYGPVLEGPAAGEIDEATGSGDRDGRGGTDDCVTASGAISPGIVSPRLKTAASSRASASSSSKDRRSG